MGKNIFSEKELLGREIGQVEKILGCEAIHLRKGEYVIILRSYWFGILQKRLYLFTNQNRVYDCFYRVDLS